MFRLANGTVAAMGKHFSAGGSVLLPIWHGVSKAEVAAYNPMVADIQALRSDEGLDALAMTNADPNTNSPQFLSSQQMSVCGSTASTAFGQITEGIAVVEKLAPSSPMTATAPPGQPTTTTGQRLGHQLLRVTNFASITMICTSASHVHQ
jgi:cyclophilin family peptidyl-prolyl cis-trans isomerase